jgi:hypothetical protein
LLFRQVNLTIVHWVYFLVNYCNLFAIVADFHMRDIIEIDSVAASS